MYMIESKFPELTVYKTQLVSCGGDNHDDHAGHIVLTKGLFLRSFLSARNLPPNWVLCVSRAFQPGYVHDMVTSCRLFALCHCYKDFIDPPQC